MNRPRLTDVQMATVDVVVLYAVSAGRVTRKGIVQAASKALRELELPHYDLDRIVAASLQRLRAAGEIRQCGRVKWERVPARAVA